MFCSNMFDTCSGFTSQWQGAGSTFNLDLVRKGRSARRYANFGRARSYPKKNLDIAANLSGRLLACLNGGSWALHYER